MLGEKILFMISALIGIGILILVHEFGHFWVARKLKFNVQEFSIGFGPKLLGWKGKDGILYNLRLFAFFGGFVRIKEIEDDLLIQPESPKARSGSEIFRRIAVIAAGPGANILLAIFLLFIYSAWWAGFRTVPEIASISEGSPAEKAGLQVGDYIVGFAYLRQQLPYSPNFFRELRCYIANNPGKPIRLLVRRDFREFVVTIVPNRKEGFRVVHTPDPNAKGLTRFLQRIFGRLEKEEFGLIGVAFKTEPIPAMPFKERLIQAFPLTWENILDTWQRITLPFTQPILLREVSGPIRIVYEVVAHRWLGVMEQVRVFALISFALAFINLFPFPILDGGRILFLLIEFIGRRRIYNLEVKANYVGLALLVALLLFVTFKDLYFVLTRGQQ
ncbi:MAG: site-2 protease family protein [Armatimonadetes bacterium]|nr:site-2 protease family protein [Armatimonadota bacterium]MDW8028806.1 M50 family metallopeptidase [Armatimonadota bacterium]